MHFCPSCGFAEELGLSFSSRAGTPTENEMPSHCTPKSAALGPLRLHVDWNDFCFKVSKAWRSTNGGEGDMQKIASKSQKR